MLLQEGWVDDGVHVEESYTSKPRESFVRLQKFPYKGDFLLSGDFKFIFWWYKEQRHCALKVLNLFNFLPSD
jgi:hypothetical protein